MTMTCQHKFIVCHKCTGFGDDDGGEARRSATGSSAPSSHFCCEPKTPQKIKKQKTKEVSWACLLTTAPRVPWRPTLVTGVVGPGAVCGQQVLPHGQGCPRPSPHKGAGPQAAPPPVGKQPWGLQAMGTALLMQVPQPRHLLQIMPHGRCLPENLMAPPATFHTMMRPTKQVVGPWLQAVTD